MGSVMFSGLLDQAYFFTTHQATLKLVESKLAVREKYNLNENGYTRSSLVADTDKSDVNKYGISRVDFDINDNDPKNYLISFNYSGSCIDISRIEKRFGKTKSLGLLSPHASFYEEDRLALDVKSVRLTFGIDENKCLTQVYIVSFGQRAKQNTP